MNVRGYSLTGKVVLRESGVGVGDVAVVLFELDRRSAARELAARIAQPAEHGRRLGSAITDPGGRFAFQFGDDACSPVDHCDGPDLLVVAMAPDDHETPQLAWVTILRAARTEAVILRVAAAALQRAGIRPPTDESHRKVQLAQITTMMRSNAALADAVREVKHEQTVVAMKRVLEPRMLAKKAFDGFTLSRLPVETRNGLFYAEHRAPVLEKVSRAVDLRMQEIRDRDAVVTKKLGVAFDPVVFEHWGVVPPDNGVSVDVPFVKVVESLRKLLGTGPLERSRSWLEIACAERRAQRELDDTIARCTNPTPTIIDEPVETPTTETDSTKLVRAQLASQFAHVVAPEIELQYGVETAGGKLSATITKSGPADVTAYHDFHDLQIAFEHVWSEAFDDNIPKLFLDVYSEMVKFSNKASGALVLPPTVKVTDLEDLYSEFKSMVQLVQAANEPEPDPPQPMPPGVRGVLPSIQIEEWNAADPTIQQQLTEMANEYAELDKHDAGDIAAAIFSFGVSEAAREVRKRELRDRAAALHESLKQQVSPTTVPGAPAAIPVGPSRLLKLFKQLDQRLSEPYRFDVFAKDSTNVGIMLTYRQQWVPLDYQVGALVSTLPLGPKEVRRYSTKTVVKKTRSERELVDQEHASRSERGSTSRADSEIVKQARDKTSFETTANATINVGVFQGQFGTKFGVDSDKSSSDTKKNFREAVLKAADEFRNKHTTEVQLTTSEETETVTSGEVSNPNDEITVTYLFYELQRQYEISELLHRLTPVVLVANDVPTPHEVDEDWLITHHWILQRALLDESLRPALKYLTSNLAGDQLALEALRENVERQVRVVEEITKQVATKTKLAESAFAELKSLVRKAGDAENAGKLQNIAMAMMLGPFALAGGGGDDDAEKRREDIAKMAVERADQASQQVTARLTTEVTALQDAIDKYVKALREFFDHELAIVSLRIHVKQNILYYMHAIWDHEPSDQRYFRLYNIEVPWIVPTTTGSPTIAAMMARSGDKYRVDTALPLHSGHFAYFEKKYRKLVEIADLDNLLGYRGNYMIFPAKEASYLHLYMMQDYIDPDGGLRDPDGLGTMTSREILDNICCLQHIDPAFVTANKAELLDLLQQRMAGPRRESDLVVVPTTSLYIEALPGAHPVMEAFKRVHRALDVKKVQGEVRHAELENLRLAARLLEDERTDPDIEKVIQITAGP